MMVHHADDLWVMGHRICDYHMLFHRVPEYTNLWATDDVYRFNACRNAKSDTLILDFGFQLRDSKAWHLHTDTQEVIDS